MSNIFKRGDKSPARAVSETGSIPNMESNNIDNNNNHANNVHEDDFF